MQNLNVEAQLKRGSLKEENTHHFSRRNYKAQNKLFKAKNAGYKPIGIILILALLIFSIYLVAKNFPSKDCSGFKESISGISCEDAVALALKNSPGTIQRISAGNMKVPDASSDTYVLVEKKLWLIDIKIDNPYTDNFSGKEVSKVRVGVDGKGIHKRALG